MDGVSQDTFKKNNPTCPNKYDKYNCKCLI